MGARYDDEIDESVFASGGWPLAWTRWGRSSSTFAKRLADDRNVWNDGHSWLKAGLSVCKNPQLWPIGCNPLFLIVPATSGETRNLITA